MTFNPVRVTIRNAIGEEGSGEPPHKVHFPRKETQSPFSGFCYAPNRVCFAVNFKKSTSLDKLRALFLVSATLQIEFAR